MTRSWPLRALGLTVYREDHLVTKDGRGGIDGFETVALTYPGYGDRPAIAQPSIEAYAAALIPDIPKGSVLVGFHTGNLGADERLATLDEDE